VVLGRCHLAKMKMSPQIHPISYFLTSLLTIAHQSRSRRSAQTISECRAHAGIWQASFHTLGIKTDSGHVTDDASMSIGKPSQCNSSLRYFLCAETNIIYFFQTALQNYHGANTVKSCTPSSKIIYYTHISERNTLKGLQYALGGFIQEVLF